MAENNPTQKEIAQQYNGNLGYFRKPHYLRRLRLWCFIAVVIASLVGVVTFGFWGKDDIFNKGPLSQNHARFSDDCAVCHVDAQTNALKAVLASRPSNHSLFSIFTGSSRTPQGASADLKPDAMSLMDQACMECHSVSALHAPQAASFALRTVSNEIPVVHATNCYTCHREHVGHDRMAPPARQTCVSCHNDASELQRTRASLPMTPSPVAATGENRNLGDGLIRFVTPPKPPGTLKPFPDYSHGHPPFGYEQANLLDPTDLKFNHERHAREDIPKLNNKKMDCTDCHEKGPEGVFYQPVRYEQHCKVCHSLQFQPTLPNLLLPHGNSDKVRFFLSSLETSFGDAVRAEGVTEPATVESRVAEELKRLQDRGFGIKQLPALEQLVFFDGYPKNGVGDPFARADVRKFLTECAKCHTVRPGGPGSPPQVKVPGAAERWVHRGKFTHVPHQHMDCVDCHKAALTSKLTSDILLPKQDLCAGCHRPPAEQKAQPKDAAMKHRAIYKLDNAAKVTAQRESGGVKFDCQSCHTFHAPADAVNLVAPGTIAPAATATSVPATRDGTKPPGAK